MAQNIDEKGGQHLDTSYPNEIEEYHSETNTAVDADSLGKSQGGFGESNANAVDVNGTFDPTASAMTDICRSINCLPIAYRCYQSV